MAAPATNPTATVAGHVARRIASGTKATPARVYTPFDFLDLGTPHSVGMALMRLVRAGTLRHLARGLYDVPRSHPLLGELLPTADDIAQALARRDGASVQPSHAMAANLLSLSDQVPARAVYETDGPSRTVKVGPLTVQLKKRPPRQVRSASPMSHLVFAALRSVGKAQVTSERIAHLRNTLSPKDRAQLLKDLPLAPAWMHPHLRFIAVLEVALRSPRQVGLKGSQKQTRGARARVVLSCAIQSRFGEELMRTISIRLDDHTDAVLTEHCRRHGLTQTDAIKTAIEQLAGQHRPTPAELAAELGLIGGFRSAEGDLAQNHSQRVKERLRAKRAAESMPAPTLTAAGAPRRRRAATA